MKFIKYILLGILSGSLLGACSTDLDEVNASENPAAPLLKNHAPIVVTEDNLKDDIVFQWEKADFGYDAAVQYQLFGRLEEGENTRILSANSLEAMVTYAEINDWLLNQGIEAGTETTVKMFLTAAIATDYVSVKSNEIEVLITGFEANKSIYEFINVAGNHQGWNPGGNPILLPVDTDGNYEGMVALFTSDPAPLFKFTDGTWDVNWGGSLSALVRTGDNIAELDEGFYFMRMNVATLKATATLYEHISIMGNIQNGNNWANDIQLTMDPDNNYLWSATGSFVAGEFKFRFNNDWGFNLGGDVNNLTNGGDNLNLTSAGDYKITLDLTAKPYKAQIEEL